MLTVNKYFDNNVVSIGFETAELPATVGVMQAGEYEFSTSQIETITVVSGALEMLLPNQQTWRRVEPFEKVVIPANQVFQLRVATASAYLCTYEDE